VYRQEGHEWINEGNGSGPAKHGLKSVSRRNGGPAVGISEVNSVLQTGQRSASVAYSIGGTGLLPWPLAPFAVAELLIAFTGYW
jgi:hypothetical protein